MPRPTKCRRVCYFPEVLEFSPTGAVSGEPIVLTIDELETMRLIDKENLSQEECGAQMALAENGIKLYGGVSGNADEAVNAFVSGNLAFNPDVHCEHHDHEHGGETHIFGDHGCGHGHCGNH